MKRLLLILMFLLPALAFGQKHAYFGTPTTIDSFNLTMWVRQFKMPRVPLVNPYFDSVGSVYLNTTTGTIYFHDGGGWQPIAGGGGGGGLQHAGPWLTVANDTVYFDTVRRLDYVLEDTDLKVPTAKAVRTALADSASDLRQVIEDTSLNLRAVFAADLADSMTVARDSVVKRVPYNGANDNLNMGNYGVTAKRANLDTLEPNSSAGLHLHNTSHQDIFIAGAGGGQNLTIYAPTSFSLMANQSETDTVLGSTSTGLVKKIGIATTYLKKADSSLYVTQYRLADTAAAIRSAIPSVAGYATTAALADSVSGRVTYVDTVALIGTQYQIDTTAFNALTRINTKGSGTVTSVGVVAGTGVSIGGTSPIATSGTYTITNTAPDQTVSLTGAGTVSVTGTYPTFTVTGTGGSGGVTSITSTGSTMQVTGTTTVNVEVDTTHSFTFTGNNTFTRDIVVDSVNVGTGNALSTNVRVGRSAFPSGTTATRITAIGENTANKITTGTDITLVGHGAGANTSVSVNGLVGLGRNTLNYSTGNNNTAIGTSCMARAVAWNGIANVGIGANSGNALTSGSSNSWLGAGAANALTSGSSNVLLGVNSGNVITTGGSNVVLGSYTGNAGGLDIRTSSNRMVLSDGSGNIRAYHNATNWLFGTVTDGSTGILQLSGNLGLNTAGDKLNIATGTNASIGTATLVAGTIEVNTTAVTASSIIMLTGVSTGAPPCATCGDLSVGTITAGSKFVINSSLATDTRVVQYWIIN